MRIQIRNDEKRLTLHLPSFLAGFVIRKAMKGNENPLSKKEWKSCMKAIRKTKKKAKYFRLVEVRSSDGEIVTIDI